MNTGLQWPILQAAVLSLVFPICTSVYGLPASPTPALPEADLPDELHRLRIHGVWRLGFHWALFHCISTLDEGQGCFGIVQGLPKLLHLTTQSEVSSLIGGFLICCCFFLNKRHHHIVYMLWETQLLSFKTPWNGAERKKRKKEEIAM